MMITYAEATEQNGMIVALDQEKAYDKVVHNYLWKALEAFGIPKKLILTVKVLYIHAETRVMVNSHLNLQGSLTRGSNVMPPL